MATDLIQLKGIEFFAYHGFYQEEQTIGNRYEVDVTIGTDLSLAGETDNLKNTVNYEWIYRAVREEMGTSARLLEHLALRIIARIQSEYPNIEFCEVSVSKINPPVKGVCNRAKVTLRR